MTREFIDFVRQHREALRSASQKWPTLARCEQYLFPPRLNREQSSSEAAACLKAKLVEPCQRVADLTGGMGVDSWALSAVATHVDYCERDAALCALTEQNFKALGLNNINCHQVDSLQWLSQLPSADGSPGSKPFDLIIIDPARRDRGGRKVAAFEQCEPDLLQCLPLLLSKGHRLLIKASPMIDITMALRQLGVATDVHIVGLQGECKEVLFLCQEAASTEPHCHIHIEGKEVFSFLRSEETAAQYLPAPTTLPQRYIYEPHPALMKAQPYRLLSAHWGLPVLSPQSHLYTSDRLIEDFPGRIFIVERALKATARSVEEALPEGRASVICRHYPLSASELQHRLKLRDGGTAVLLGTTVGTRPTMLLCRQLQSAVKA